MSSKSSGKSPYQRSNTAARGRSWMLKATAAVLLIAAAVWIATYTGLIGSGGNSTAPVPGANPASNPVGTAQ
jgi:hypothetical protein